MAARIMLNNDSFNYKFNLMDIIPFSLGVNARLYNSDKNVQNEGNLMNVIIKRGTKLPTINTKDYYINSYCETIPSFDMYEGEKKYVKYNHIFAKIKLLELTPAFRRKYKKIKIKFFIDINGILTITGEEEDPEGKKDNKIKVIVKNDGIELTMQEIEEIKEKNRNFLNHCIKEPIDYYYINEILKDYQDAYNETQDEEDKFNILMGLNGSLEVFINEFDKNFDNETILKKFYIYIKKLFISYGEIFILKKYLDRDDQITIINNIEEYCKFFINLNSGYLDDLLEVLKNIPKKIFIEIIVFIMEKLNECGINCLKSKQKFSRYTLNLNLQKTFS